MQRHADDLYMSYKTKEKTGMRKSSGHYGFRGRSASAPVISAGLYVTTIHVLLENRFDGGGEQGSLQRSYPPASGVRSSPSGVLREWREVNASYGRAKNLTGVPRKRF